MAAAEKGSGVDLASQPSTEPLSLLSELSLPSTQALCSELIFSLRKQTQAPDILDNKTN